MKDRWASCVVMADLRAMVAHSRRTRSGALLDTIVKSHAVSRQVTEVKYWLNVGFLETEQLIPIARAAEELGYEGLSLPDHLVHPSRLESIYPYSPDGQVGWSQDAPWPDCW